MRAVYESVDDVVKLGYLKMILKFKIVFMLSAICLMKSPHSLSKRYQHSAI
jgi:hypothetical protein